MGDRTTPMKFGPEWLRNLSREPRQSDGLGGHGSGGGFGSPGNSNQQNRSVTSIASPNTNALTNTSKVLLAKLRYGREEMLALYDSETAEAPPDLLCMDSLYYPRGKAPYALSNNFEDETRDVAIRRSDPPIGSLAPDRYTAGRGRGMGMGMGDGVRGRVTNAGEGRGRARLYVRQTSTGSETFRNPSWHNGVQRGYSGAPEDDSNPRWNNNGSSMYPPGIGMRTASEQTDWATRMAYRKTRQNNTNWRQQQNRDEGEEWRADGVRRGGQEKWSGEREWPEKPAQDRSWNNNNRRTWGDNSEDTLPEWAVENSEGYAGTFDSLGAFHGYSHDDSNIPKQEASHPLARSHTHGSFARSKTIEEGSDEWWASEKAKKLSAKRFDATEVKFKKPSTPGITVENTSTNTNTCNTNPGQMRDKAKDSVTKQSASQDETHHKASPDLQDEAAALPSKHEHYNKQNQEKPKERTEYQSAYSENSGRSAQNRIDRLLQTEEIEPTNERGNYKSVMMATNNNPLRQKHQNIGAPTNHPPNRLIRLLENAKQNQARQNLQSDEENKQKQQENKLVEEILDMKLDDEQESSTMSKLMSSTNQATVMASAQLPRPGIQMRMNNLANAHLMNQQSQNMPSQGSMMRPLGMHNSMLNASLGLNIGAGSNVGMPLTSMATPLPNSAMLSSGLQGLAGNMQGPMQGMQSGLQPSNLQVGSMQSGIQIPGMQANSYQSQSGMPGNMQGAMANTNLESGSGMSGFTGVSGVGNNSLFMQQGACTMQNPNDMSGHGSNMYPMQGHGLQQSSSQSSYNASLYANMIQPPQPPIQLPFPHIALTEQWYYEDPKKVIQGPFTSKEMMRWYLAGFFSPQLLVRRACDSEMTPLANYGLMPFGPMDIIPPQFNRTAFDLRSQLSHDNNLMNNQPGLGPEVESLWSQPTASDMMWMQQTMAARDDNSRINTLPMYFWDQPSGMASALLPEGITKDMKTEDDILAQMRANQDPATQNLTFMSEQPLSLNPEDAFTAGTNIAPNLEELQKLIESDVHGSSAHRSEGTTAMADPTARTISLPQPNANAAPNLAEQKKQETLPKVVDTIPEVSAKQSIKSVEPKSPKQPPKEAEKPAKPKEVAVVKPKKKTKDEKDAVEVKAKDDDVNTTVKRTAESSPPKNKKEEKPNKKEMEKEKKEWLKDGFTIVKSTEKKDNKKKEKEEARAAEEAEKKRKEEEKRAQMEAEKNRQPEPVTRRQQMEIGQAQRSQQLQQQQQQLQQQQLEQAPKKAPWSAPAAAGRDHLALADIQRLEREKKLEQKEHQLILQAIAAQHQTAALREQEAQAQIGWATKKQQNNSPPGQTLAQIQAEARKQAAAIAAAATAAACEEALVTPPPVQAAPWGAINGVGFWDTSVGSVPSPAPAMQPSLSCNRLSEPTRLPEPKPKKKVAVVTQAKKETTPSADFDIWCTNVLSNWRDVNIDVPTFVAFLRDIESPYEVKDYVKCYLGDTKESTDFSRQFLERRSRLLRVGMVAPTDDLGAPAAALTPRTNSGSDYTEVKGKSKKTKKNKMFKVDARILGFSVTASEDRINIGDIDTV